MVIIKDIYSKKHAISWRAFESPDILLTLNNAYMHISALTFQFGSIFLEMKLLDEKHSLF